MKNLFNVHFLHTIFTALGKLDITAGLCHTFEDPNVSGEHFLQSNLEVVTVCERKAKFALCMQNLKISQVEISKLLLKLKTYITLLTFTSVCHFLS